MPNRARQVGTIAAILAVGAVAATAWWWWDARTRPDAVARRIAQAAIARYPAATVGAPAARIERVTLESGRSIDLSLTPVIARCRDDRFACSGAIDTAIDDLGRVEKLAEAPDREALRALVVDEDLRGFQLGLIAEPLVGPLEVRYALVSGSASSFVTPTIADRLGLNPAQLREIALAHIAVAGAPRVEALRDSPGLYQVLGDPDPGGRVDGTGPHAQDRRDRRRPTHGRDRSAPRRVDRGARRCRWATRHRRPASGASCDRRRFAATSDRLHVRRNPSREPTGLDIDRCIVTGPRKIPRSVLVVIHTYDLRVLLLERADRAAHWQSVTGSVDTLDEPLHATAIRRGPRRDRDRCAARRRSQRLEPPHRIRHLSALAASLCPGCHTQRRVLFGLALPDDYPERDRVRVAPREHLQYAWLPFVRPPSAVSHPATPRPSSGCRINARHRAERRRPIDSRDRRRHRCGRRSHGNRRAGP